MKYVYKVNYSYTELVPNREDKLFHKVFEVDRLFTDKDKAFKCMDEGLFIALDCTVQIQLLTLED